MPNFSASPVVELYDPANVVAIYTDSEVHDVIKGTFKEEVVEVAGPYENSRPVHQQMFEFQTTYWDDTSPSTQSKRVRVIGQSTTIKALIIDDLEQEKS
jgi:hypothetical protein